MLTRTMRPMQTGDIEWVMDRFYESGLASILEAAHRAGPRGEAEARDRLECLDADLAELDRLGRLRDFAFADRTIEPIVKSLGLDAPADEQGKVRLRQRAYSGLKSMKRFERSFEETGCPREAAAIAGIPPARLNAAEAGPAQPGTDLGTALEAATRYAVSKDMRNHVASAGRLMTEVLGSETPLDLVTEDDLIRVLIFARRLPYDHGRYHGINRHTKDKAAARAALPSKAEEIAEADAADAAIRGDVAALDVAAHEKIAIIASSLTRRINPGTMKKVHAHMFHVFHAARHHLGWKGCTPRSVMKAYREKAKALADRERAENTSIVTSRRVRRSWTDERIQKLLTSPIYTGCASPKRRYLMGSSIIRDAFYWLPLLMLTMGLRPSEILQLHKGDVILRDSVYAITINEKFGKRVKREASVRTVPIPQILISLGFLDWVNAQRELRGRFLFPEIMEAIGAGDSPAGLFGGRFDAVRRELKITDESEDVYAMRRTQSTRMANAGVCLADRSALLGHAQVGITNLHYTETNLPRMKTLIDSLDYRLEITFSEARGFPVIANCTLVERASVLVHLKLDRFGEPFCVTLFAGEVVGEVDYAAEIHPLRSWAAFDSGDTRDTAKPARLVVEALSRLIGDRRVVLLDRRTSDAFECFMSLWCD